MSQPESGEMDLNTLLRSMRPVLHEQPQVFCTLSLLEFELLPFEPLCSFREQEGVTVITSQQIASENGLPYEATWAWITLSVHSSLSAVGFLAVITERLAAAGISTNTVSAYYHDHMFVQWELRQLAMEVLEGLQADS